MADNVTPTGTSGRSGGPSGGSGGAPATGGATGSSNGGGASRAGDGNRGSSDSRPVANAVLPAGGANPGAAIGDKRPPGGRNDTSTPGVRPTSSGDNPRGSRGNGDGGQRSASGSAKETPLQLVGGLEDTPDAEEEPQRPLYIGIPRATKAEKAQNAPVRPKGKAADVDSETVAIGVSIAFEVPAIICQLITPLEGGHPWWSKSPEQVHEKVAVPLTDVINGMSPKVKKLIKENTAAAAVLVGIVSLMQEPIAMEMELRRQITLARRGIRVETGGLPEARASSNGVSRQRVTAASSGLQGARQFVPPLGDEADEGDFAV